MTHSELHWLSAGEVVRLIAIGELSAREALQAHWDRIDEVNPLVNAVIYENREQAWADASSADEYHAARHPLPLLHGLPLTNKDSNDTAGMPTTWGSSLLRTNVPKTDDIMVGRLRSAGAVLTGKSNVPEFAAGAHTFNEVYGVTRNPYALALSAGGSSGGVASALAAGIQALGDGSDMGGSLRIPASFCNVVGLRPSRGRIPMLSVNSWAWLGHTGPMAREVRDVALAMRAVSGPDPRSPLSIQEDASLFGAPLERDLHGIRIGWSRDFGLGMPIDPRIIAVMEKALAVFESLGAIVEEASPDLSEADFVFAETRAFDLEIGLGALVRGNPEAVKPEVLWNVEKGRTQTSADLRELALARTRLEGRVREFFTRYDVFLTPTAQSLPFPVELRYQTEIAGIEMETYLDWMRSVCVVSAMDVPALSVPAGFTDDGLPVGMQLVGEHGADILLLQIAFAFEQATRHFERRPQLGAGRTAHGARI